ncbi:MAG: dihydropteroate synthase-like protein [Candidatus Bathyarchaeota archaeon]|nr:MAG: dihydropteroate synthase-like protein [Candidatus Bathyarchaeota archaeon]
MKVLLVTGALAEDSVKRYAQKSSVETQVLKFPIQVAALLKLPNIAKELKKVNLKDFDAILVPGLILGDTTVVSDATGVPAFKGPRYAADLPIVLDSMEKLELSTVTPACDLLREELQRKALQQLDLVELNKELLLKNPGNMVIKNLAFGKDFPMRVMAEIVDAPLMSVQELQRTAKRYVKSGAHIIDVGMIAGDSRPADAQQAVEAVKEVVNVPISIDTLDPLESQAAVSAGADLILSLDAGNIDELSSFASEVAVVAIPTNQRQGYFPKTVDERVAYMEQIIAKARKLGVNNILADLIVEPMNVLRSFVAFGEFAKRNPEVPLFVGTTNFTELIDADSVGVNALLACLSSEVNGSILLATEKSSKAKGTVRELALASKMMFLAKQRGSVPKDLGLDLLILKDKRLRQEPYSAEMEADTQVIFATETLEPEVMDEKGIFKIAVDHISGNIIALYLQNIQTEKPSIVIKGKTSENVFSKIEEMNLITRMDHAAYLGRELAKAEIALKTEKEYVQDQPLFKDLSVF